MYVPSESSHWYYGMRIRYELLWVMQIKIIDIVNIVFIIEDVVCVMKFCNGNVNILLTVMDLPKGVVFGVWVVVHPQITLGVERKT